MSSVVEEVNDKHMTPWAEACRKDGVENSPLSPYIDQELLYNKHLYLQPGKLSNSTGFMYLYPKLTKDALAEVNYCSLHESISKKDAHTQIRMKCSRIYRYLMIM